MSDLYANSVLPVYLAVDISRSMAGERLNIAQDLVAEIADTLSESHTFADSAHVSLMEFASDANLVLPLSRLSDIPTLPKLSPIGGVTDYTPLFQLLHTVIALDVTTLFADGMAVLRPVALVLTDGEVGRPWLSAFIDLTEYDPQRDEGFPWYPTVVPVGIQPGDEEVLHSMLFPLRQGSFAPVADRDGARRTALQIIESLAVTRLRPSTRAASLGTVSSQFL